jgi:hypothetical protein
MEETKTPPVQTETQPTQAQEQPAQEQPKPEKTNGLTKFWFIPVILAVIILLVAGGLWVSNQGFFKKEPVSTPAPTPSPAVETHIDEDTAALEEQGTSDEISAIEEDLEATDFSNLDKELSEIESELAAP